MGSRRVPSLALALSARPVLRSAARPGGKAGSEDSTPSLAAVSPPKRASPGAGRGSVPARARAASIPQRRAGGKARTPRPGRGGKAQGTGASLACSFDRPEDAVGPSAVAVRARSVPNQLSRSPSLVKNLCTLVY